MNTALNTPINPDADLPDQEAAVVLPNTGAPTVANASQARPVTTTPPTAFKLTILLFLASAAICVLGYLAVAVPGSWFGKAPTLQFGLRDLGVTKGTIQPGSEGFVAVAPDPTGTVIVAINTSLRSTDYPVIAWDVGDIAETESAAILWRNDYEPGRVFTQPLIVEGGRLLAVSLAQHPNWIGKISGLALIVRGAFPRAIQIRGATAKPMSAFDVMSDRAREWLDFEGWNGTSINTISGGADVQELPLPFLLGGIVALAAVVYLALARWRQRYGGHLRLVVLAALFMTAWIILDVRFQWNLFRQVDITGMQYAGKSWRDRHLAAEDGPLFAFIEKVREKLPPPPARILMAADAHYFRDRGAYHLYPYNVYFDPTQNVMLPTAWMKSGDFVVVYQRKGVQYDPSKQLLRWDGGAPIPADLLLTDNGAALFRIR